jgi:hypothetical protein
MMVQRHPRCAGLPLSSNARACVLAATSVSSEDPGLAAFEQRLHELCASGGTWLHVALNFFNDMGAFHAAKHSAASCVEMHGVGGFKTRFWKRVLTPMAVRQYTHIWLFDSDLNVAPASFALPTMIQIMFAINVSIIAPAPFGGPSPGHFQYFGTRCRNNACRCAGKHDWPDSVSLDVNCVACRQPIAEVKSPVFTVEAWGVIYQLLLATLPEAILNGDFLMDLHWCSIVDHIVHGCDGRHFRDSKVARLCVARFGGACATSYATPIQHLDHRTINRSTFENGQALAHMRHIAHGILGSYLMYPSHRPHGTLLATKPCWSARELTTVLTASNWSAQSLPRAVAARAMVDSCTAASIASNVTSKGRPLRVTDGMRCDRVSEGLGLQPHHRGRNIRA